MLDLEDFKGATLDEGKFNAIKAAFDELVGQRDAAREESIKGRKGKDAKIGEAMSKLDEAQRRVERMAERLGIEPDADLDSLPDAKGMAEAARQYEAKVRRLERENGELIKQRDEAGAKLAGTLREQQIAKSMDGLQFKNASDARVLIERRVKDESGELLFETDDGKLVPLVEGVQWFAKTRPDYVQAQDGGGQGSGFKGSNARGAGGGGGGSKQGDLGGDKSARVAALKERFPDLA